MQISSWSDQTSRPQAYDDPAEMYLRSRPDAVIIATPHTARFEQGMQALAAGCHILMEKPMVTNSAQAHFLFVRDVIRNQKFGKLEMVSGYLAQNWLRYTGVMTNLIVNGNCPVDHGALSFFFDNGKIDVDGWYSKWIRCWHGQTEVPAELGGRITTPVDNFVDAMYESAATGLPARPRKTA